MKGIVLLSHGKLAEGMLDTLQIFLDNVNQIRAVCLTSNEDLFNYTNQIKEAINRVDTGKGVVVFCDLLFGTPFNCCAKLLEEDELSGKIDLITGMNLPMLLEYVTSQSDNDSFNEIISTGQKGIVNFLDLYKNKN